MFSCGTTKIKVIILWLINTGRWNEAKIRQIKLMRMQQVLMCVERFQGEASEELFSAPYGKPLLLFIDSYPLCNISHHNDDIHVNNNYIRTNVIHVGLALFLPPSCAL